MKKQAKKQKQMQKQKQATFSEAPPLTGTEVSRMLNLKDICLEKDGRYRKDAKPDDCNELAMLLARANADAVDAALGLPPVNESEAPPCPPCKPPADATPFAMLGGMTEDEVALLVYHLEVCVDRNGDHKNADPKENPKLCATLNRLHIDTATARQAVKAYAEAKATPLPPLDDVIVPLLAQPFVDNGHEYLGTNAKGFVFVANKDDVFVVNEKALYKQCSRKDFGPVQQALLKR